MRLAAVPSRNSACSARMLAAVAEASPDTTSLPPTIAANVLVRIVINQKTPAALALTRGDASAIRSVIADALMLVPPHVSDLNQGGLRRPRVCGLTLRIRYGGRTADAPAQHLPTRPPSPACGSQVPWIAVLDRTPSAASRNAFVPVGPVSSSHIGPLPGSTVRQNLRKAQHSCSSWISCVRSAKTSAPAANRRAYPSSRGRLSSTRVKTRSSNWARRCCRSASSSVHAIGRSVILPSRSSWGLAMPSPKAPDAPAQLRRAHVSDEFTPRLTPDAGCNGSLATTPTRVRSRDRRRWNLEQPGDRRSGQDHKREYANQRAVWHSKTA